ncbi:MAG: hypothetical protein HY001_00825 [Candidatus Portnoybacteria bacterium]|nr:hypothetical protein [Candidatus Portnoybacteria bacterium]
MVRFAEIRGKKAWVDFIRVKALNKKESDETMRGYIKRVAALAGHPGENPSIPSLRDAIHELISEGEIEAFPRGNTRPLKKRGGGRKKVQKTERREKKPVSERNRNKQGNRSSPILDLLLGTVELNSRTNRALALLAEQVATLVTRVSFLFEQTEEIEEARKRLQEVLRDSEKMEKTLMGEFK